MESEVRKRVANRVKRAKRVRLSLSMHGEKPRLTVRRSNQHLSAQIVRAGCTLAFSTTQMKKYREQKFTKNKTAARAIGSHIAELAKEQNITSVVFDRGPCKYHGVIAELADAARGAGLQF